MNRKRKTIFVVFTLLAFVITGSGTVFAQATVKEVAGKVEVKPPKGAWGAAFVGMRIGAGSMVATGFNSKAVIELDGSKLWVNQLTRLTLEEIARQQGVIKTNLYIRSGSLEAEVKTGENYTHDFKVRSPVSTAAVRGTIIKYNGMILFTKEGKATLFNLLGQPATVFRDGSAMSDDGIALYSSNRLYLTGFRVPLYSRPGVGSREGSTSYPSNETIVIFYPVFD